MTRLIFFVFESLHGSLVEVSATQKNHEIQQIEDICIPSLDHVQEVDIPNAYSRAESPENMVDNSLNDPGCIPDHLFQMLQPAFKVGQQVIYKPNGNEDRQMRNMYFQTEDFS